MAIGRSLVYAHVGVGLLPKPVRLGARAVGWPSNEIDAVVAARIAGRSDVEIKALVAEMMVARKAAA